MKRSFSLVTILVAGCVSRQVDPHLVVLEVEPITQPCRTSDTEIAVPIGVRNKGRGPIRLWIDSKHSGPPYKISWLSYEVLDQAGDDDWKHGPGGHGPMPPHTLSIGSGDSTRLLAYIYDIGDSDHDKEFKIRFNDIADNSYTSTPFKPCIKGGA